MTDGDEFQRNERSTGVLRRNFASLALRKPGKGASLSRGGILKYNWRLSPTRAKRYLVTRGPTDRGCYARQSTSSARGGDSPSHYASACPYGLTAGRGTRRVEVDASAPSSTPMRRAASSFHTGSPEASRQALRLFIPRAIKLRVQFWKVSRLPIWGTETKENAPSIDLGDLGTDLRRFRTKRGM